jgi:hypothetical protein
VTRFAVRARPYLGEVEPDRWLTTAEAATYLAYTENALHKRTAARAILIQQDCRGGKLYFKRSQLDAWREGRS